VSAVFASPHILAAAPASGIGGVASVTAALLLVLAAIFGVAWLARRVRGFGSRIGGAVDVLADVPLGPKERAVLLQVGAEQILLGVAPGRVNRLHVLAEPLEVGRAAAAAVENGRPSFRSILKRSLGK
jgi:flagellar protein FliO/FliZ